MKPKFDKLTARVKGYLTRRLLHTEKIQLIIQTIRDTVELLLELYTEEETSSPNLNGSIGIKKGDRIFHHGLVHQVRNLKISTDQMKLKIVLMYYIAADQRVLVI